MAGGINKLCLHCLQYGLDEQQVCRFCGQAFSAQTEKPFHLPPRDILAGKYMVARVLGEGGFGITYLGWDINLELKVAIKEYYPSGFVARDSTSTSAVTSFSGGADDFFLKGRDRFVDEARSLAKFHQLAGIVQVRDFFLENGTAYIVMEFLEGLTLKERLDAAGGCLPEDEVLALMKPLIESLALVHAAGVIHRDISPDNLMLTPTGHLKLLDFGAARYESAANSKSLSVILKAGYAPEEQYRSRGEQGP